MRGLNPDFEIQRSALGRGEVVRDNQTVGPTNIELEKGGAGEGGVVEPLSSDLLVGERQSIVCV